MPGVALASGSEVLGDLGRPNYYLQVEPVRSRPRLTHVPVTQPEAPAEPGQAAPLAAPLGASAPAAPLPPAPARGWRRARLTPTLAESYRTVSVQGAGWRKALAFAGPGYLVAVGYMDPGNWATDLAGGARFGYALLSVMLVSNLHRRPAAGARASGSASPRAAISRRPAAITTRAASAIALWICCEIAIAACDLAEVIGSAIALKLLFGIPLTIGVIITSLDVLLVLYLQHHGFRCLEARRHHADRDDWRLLPLRARALAARTSAGRGRGSCPCGRSSRTRAMLYIAIGILGATVMPHNLYLHSSIVQTRRYEETSAGQARGHAVRVLDSTVALTFALFINAAILVVAAATFHLHRPHRRRRDPGRLQAADPAARRDRRQRRSSPWRCLHRTELDAHRERSPARS